jgi:CHAT domain-containing protein
LTADGVDDGYLHLTEIVRHHTAPVVILSACSAVPGPVLGPEGPIGLARAFLAAGSRSVIGTEWPVGPSAAVFAAHLHRYLAAGRSPTEAVRMAKLDLLADPATASPFHWGTWVVVGG